MGRVIAVVEGQTEQTFVRVVLAPYLEGKGVWIDARLVGKPGHKGGVGAYASARQDMLLLLRQESTTTVTTMFDFYGMPNSWPGRVDSGTKAPAQRAACVEDGIRKDIERELGGRFDCRRFIPYVQMHEFEAILFSHPAMICDVLGCAEVESRIQAIRDAFTTPEDINDNPNTAPSKRLEALLSGYNKRTNGVIAASRIGLETIRSQCPHFSQWVGKLEMPA